MTLNRVRNLEKIKFLLSQWTYIVPAHSIKHSFYNPLKSWVSLYFVLIRLQWWSIHLWFLNFKYQKYHPFSSNHLIIISFNAHSKIIISFIFSLFMWEKWHTFSFISFAKHEKLFQTTETPNTTTNRQMLHTPRD